jgi:hypothetical protein
MVKIAKNAEEKVRIAFLPFTSVVHLCTIKFTDREHGSFCYELDGTALPPAVCAEHEFVMDINQPVTVSVPITPTNPGLEAAKRIFMDGHPLAKQKEMVKLLNAQKSRAHRPLAADAPCIATFTCNVMIRPDCLQGIV